MHLISNAESIQKNERLPDVEWKVIDIRQFYSTIVSPFSALLLYDLKSISAYTRPSKFWLPFLLKVSVTQNLAFLQAVRIPNA